MFKTILLLLCVLASTEGDIKLVKTFDDLPEHLQEGIDSLSSVLRGTKNYHETRDIESAIDTRIIGGSTAGYCQFPWMAKLVYRNGLIHTCGGTIIGKRHILTAAHCFFHPHTLEFIDESNFLVLTGSSTISNYLTSDIQHHFIARTIVHENYLRSQSDYDIAILELTDEIQFNQCNKPLALVKGMRTPEDASRCYVMGWGSVSGQYQANPVQLQYIEAQFVSDYECQHSYPAASENTFCAGLQGRGGACSGDSGGPLVCTESDGKRYVYGIVIQIEYGTGQRFCLFNLNLYTKVSAFLDWIASNKA